MSAVRNFFRMNTAGWSEMVGQWLLSAFPLVHHAAVLPDRAGGDAWGMSPAAQVRRRRTVIEVKEHRASTAPRAVRISLKNQDDLMNY